MQFSCTKSTMPLAYCTIAPGDGQALRQPGSSQCMQPSLRISHSRLSPFSYSAKRITVNEAGVRSVGLLKLPSKAPIGWLRSFHSRQAVWQALQPMHLETSISLATSTAAGLPAGGGGTEEADRRRRSRD